MLKNKPFLIAVMALAVVLGGVSTVIFLEESISISDRVETEGIPVTSDNEPIFSSSSGDAGWSRVLTLTLSNLPTLGETAEVVLVVNNTSKSPAPSAFVTGMSLSGNFEVLNPPSNIQSFDHGGFFIKEPMPYDLPPNETLTMNWTIRAVEEGEAAIFGGGLGGSTAIRLVIGAEETLLKEDFDRLYPSQRQDSPPQGDYPNHDYSEEDPNEVVDNSNPFEGMTDDQIREEIEQMGYEGDEIEEVLVELKELFANSTSIEDLDLEKQSFFDLIMPKVYASTPPTFSLYGKITNTNSPYDPDSETNVYDLSVCAVDKNLSRHGSFTTLNFVNGNDACTRTSESGVYYIRNIVNNDPNDNTGVDVYLVYKTDGSYVDIKNKNDLFYTGDKYVRNNLSTSSSTIRTDDNISNEIQLHRAAWILDVMSEAREFFDDENLRITIPVTVKWQYNKDLSTISDSNKCGDNACYDRLTNTIWLDGNDDFDSFKSGDEDNIQLQLHEYGHHVMKTVYGNNGWGSGCPSPHMIDKISSTSCAWSEGWAGFVPHFVLDEAQIQRDSFVIYDLERDGLFLPNDSTQGITTSWEKQASYGWAGHEVEGQVASMLWDIHDSSQNRSDFSKDTINPTNNSLDDEIVSAFKKYNSITKNSAEDYYTDWNRLNPSFPLESIAELHYMAFANDVSVANDQSVTVSQDTPKRITLTATDDEGERLTYNIRNNPSHGTLSSIVNGVVTFTPSTGYSGSDSFRFRVTDGSSFSNIATVSITITESTTITPPTSSTIFSDDFEGTLSQWTLTGDDEIWELRSGIPTGTTGNVASSDDCDKNCYMVSDTINTSQATTLTFDRYVSTRIDTNEGLRVEVSTNNGRTWSELVFYTTVPRSDDSTWHSETLNISQYQSSTFKIKFTGVSSSSSEIVQLDNVSITGSSGGTLLPPPPTTTSSSFEENFDDLSNWSKSGTDRWDIVSTWREGMPEDGSSDNKILVASGCVSECILTSNTIDLSSYTSATLELSRFVDRSIDDGEYLAIEVYNGSTWTELAKWGDTEGTDSDDWESESFNISQYLDDDFKIKLITKENKSSEDVGLDYIRIVT